MSAKHLAIELSSKDVLFTLFRNDVISESFNASYSGKTEAELKESLKHIFESTPTLQGDFDEVTVAWCETKSTLVPNAVFSESSPEALFKLCFGDGTHKDEIDYNRISELSVINIYQIPTWVKSFFVLRYPRVVMQHAGTHMIRKALNENTFKLKATIVYFEDHFRMTIVKHNGLEFYSSFDYQNANDIMYQLTFALQQKELTNEPGSIEISNSAGADIGIFKELKQGLDKIGELQKMDVVLAEHYLAKSQELCV